MKKFKIIDDYKYGYINKRDVTNADSRALIAPSQNVVINDAEKIEVRKGYTLFGSAGTSGEFVDSSYDWKTSTGVEKNLRKINGQLQYLYGSGLSAIWRDLKYSFNTAARLQFAEWWSTGEKIDLLLFVDAYSSNIYSWSGGVTTFASATTNTITKQGTTTWAQERFLTIGTRKLWIDNIEYTYTGGEGTTTLTGVTPDPTAGSHSVGAVAHQSIVSTANKPDTDIIGTSIAVLYNQAWVIGKKGNSQQRTVWVSKNTDYTDFAFTTPTRIPGEGAIITLDANPVALIPQEEDMYISCENDFWYRSQFTLSSALTNEIVGVKRLKTGPGQGAWSQDSVGNIKNSVIFVSKEKTIDTLGRLENITTPQSLPLSDSIKNELTSYSYVVNPHIKYFKGKTHFAFPSEQRVLIYDHEKALWNPPQTLPIRRFSEINGELYGHSSIAGETYKLNDGYSDNGNPINAKVYFAYRNYGRRDWQKKVDEWFSEGYMSPNTTLTLVLRYDFGGFTSVVTKTLSGAELKYFFSTASDNSLGKYPLGKNGLGSITDSVDDLPKFRVIHNVLQQNFYEIGVGYESDGVDQRWQLLCQGGNVQLTASDNTNIKKN